MTPNELRQGGVVLRIDTGIVFVAAAVARKFVATPKIAAVPDAPVGLVGVVLTDGTVIPVVAFGARRDAMLVCTYRGEAIGIVGYEVIASGTFEASHEIAGAVKCDAGIAKPLDLAQVAASLGKNAWARRSTG